MLFSFLVTMTSRGVYPACQNKTKLYMLYPACQNKTKLYRVGLSDLENTTLFHRDLLGQIFQKQQHVDAAITDQFCKQIESKKK